MHSIWKPCARSPRVRLCIGREQMHSTRMCNVRLTLTVIIVPTRTIIVIRKKCRAKLEYQRSPERKNVKCVRPFESGGVECYGSHTGWASEIVRTVPSAPRPFDRRIPGSIFIGYLRIAMHTIINCRSISLWESNRICWRRARDTKINSPDTRRRRTVYLYAVSRCVPPASLLTPGRTSFAYTNNNVLNLEDICYRTWSENGIAKNRSQNASYSNNTIPIRWPCLYRTSCVVWRYTVRIRRPLWRR